jgi:ankyrin repeat protein/thiol-disulfide isomerase/thioredoxin
MQGIDSLKPTPQTKISTPQRNPQSPALLSPKPNIDDRVCITATKDLGPTGESQENLFERLNQVISKAVNTFADSIEFFIQGESISKNPSKGEILTKSATTGLKAGVICTAVASALSLGAAIPVGLGVGIAAAVLKAFQKHPDAQKDTEGMTGLMHAVMRGDPRDIKKLLSRGANINEKNLVGWTPLMLAAKNGNLEIVKFLISQGANIQEKDIFGDTVLLSAVRGNHPVILNFLMSQGSFDINEKNSWGDTALMRAALWGKLETVKFLTSQGAKIDEKDRFGETALMMAQKKGHEEVVELLITQTSSTGLEGKKINSTQPRKYLALVLNGDTEARHVKNVKQAYRRFINNYDYVHILSPVLESKNEGNLFLEAPSQKNISHAINQIRTKLTQNPQSELFVYTTGHGDLNNGKAQLVLPDGYADLSELAKLQKEFPQAKFTVVMDQCYSGNMKEDFTSANTLFYANSAPDETTNCVRFAEAFWRKEIPDQDQNRKISIAERIQYAKENLEDEFKTKYQLAAGQDYYDTGIHPQDLVNYIKVESANALEKELKNPDSDVKVVMFSTTWCGPCHTYEPEYKFIGDQFKGSANFIKYQPPHEQGEEEMNTQYNISKYPTIKIFKNGKEVFEVNDRAQLSEILSKYTKPQ